MNFSVSKYFTLPLPMRKEIITRSERSQEDLDKGYGDPETPRGQEVWIVYGI